MERFISEEGPISQELPAVPGLRERFRVVECMEGPEILPEVADDPLTIRDRVGIVIAVTAVGMSMIATSASTRGRSRGPRGELRQASEVAEEDLVPPPGLSYVCRGCNVYGYLSTGEHRACWCCDEKDRMERR